MSSKKNRSPVRETAKGYVIDVPSIASYYRTRAWERKEGGTNPGYVSVETHFRTLREASGMIAMERVRGAVRLLDFSNDGVTWARKTASSHLERMGIQVELAGRALRSKRMAAETPRINAGAFRSAENIWRALELAVKARERAFVECQKAIDNACELMGAEAAWTEIIGFVMRPTFGLSNSFLIAEQLRGDGLWGCDFDSVRGWVKRSPGVPNVAAEMLKSVPESSDTARSVPEKSAPESNG